MLKKQNYITASFISLLLLILCSCSDPATEDQQEVNKAGTGAEKKANSKPPATYADTLLVNLPAAVFFEPDSIQLKKIQAQSDSMVFDGTMHEYFFQMRNARIVLKKNWPGLQIKDAKNYSCILFLKNDHSQTLIDINANNNACGLFVFDGKKSPVLIDMTNLETEVSFYLKKQ
jgi:hypothetical protein